MENSLDNLSLSTLDFEIKAPCTGCRCCCGGCPAGINIPRYIKLYKACKEDITAALETVSEILSKGKPADCIGCGNCRMQCPYRIDTPKIMAELAKVVR